MDGGAAGTGATPALSGGQAGSNPVGAQVPTSQPSLASWGISPGDSSSLHAQQQWMPNSGRHNGNPMAAHEMAGAWQQWPAHGGELAMAANNKVTPSLPVLTLVKSSVLPCVLSRQLHLLQHPTDSMRLTNPRFTERSW